jgi:hypothetical protein
MTLVEDLHGISDYYTALARILEHFEADGGTIHILGDNGMLELKAYSQGMPESILAAIQSIPPGKGMAGVAFDRNDVVDSCNLQEDDCGGAIHPGAKSTGFSGSIAVPIRDQDDNARGTLGIAAFGERSFTSAECTELISCGKAIGWGG